MHTEKPYHPRTVGRVGRVRMYAVIRDIIPRR